jgi:hypothetical protein
VAAITGARADDATLSTQTQAAVVRTPLDSVFGKKLTGIDGTMIELSSAKGSLSREMSLPNGALQRLNFAFINDRLGTVSDTKGGSNVTGVFRATVQEILIHYADGSVELLRANAAGGLSIETKTTKGGFLCKAFYPDGHVFSLNERKAALAEFAGQLGLADLATNSAVSAKIPCGMAVEGRLLSPPAIGPAAAAEDRSPASSQAQAASPEATLVPAIAPLSVGSTLPNNNSTVASAAAVPLLQLSPAGNRVASNVELKSAAESNTATGDKTALAERTPGARPAVQIINDRPSQVQAIDKTPDSGMSLPLEPTNTDLSAETGASSCLSVESDGMHWGFRNRCSYDVQFSYCTMDGRNPLTGCRERAVGGSVASNGFGVLVEDENLKAVNASHDFRWVACKGGAGEVIARLDQVDPPSGRCIR